MGGDENQDLVIKFIWPYCMNQKLTLHAQWLPIHLVHPCQLHSAKLVRWFQTDLQGPIIAIGIRWNPA